MNNGDNGDFNPPNFEKLQKALGVKEMICQLAPKLLGHKVKQQNALVCGVALLLLFPSLNDERGMAKFSIDKRHLFIQAIGQMSTGAVAVGHPPRDYFCLLIDEFFSVQRISEDMLVATGMASECQLTTVRNKCPTQHCWN